MLKSVKFLVILFLSTNVSAQNLITNPGFEDGTSGWNDFWSFTPGAGISEIVSQPVHSGSKAMRIEHWGEQYWSFGPEGNFDVSPGHTYKYSAWVNVAQLAGEGQLCITTYDATETVLDWSYLLKNFSLSSGEFQQYTVEFVIPQGTQYIWPRFTGDGGCELWVDDVEFILTDSSQVDKKYTLENNSLKADVFQDFSFEITNKINHKTYTSQGSADFKIQSVDSTQNAYSFHCRYLPESTEITVKLTLVENTIEFQLTADGEAALSNNMAFPGMISTSADEYFIIPHATGVIIPVTEYFPSWGFTFWSWKATMSFLGVTNMNNGYMITTDDPWDTKIEFNKPPGEDRYALQLLHAPDKQKFAYDRTFYYTFFADGDYVEMCEWYRAYAEEKGYVKTLQEKTAENPNIEKLIGAVDFWLLDDQLKNIGFIDQLIDFGIDRALFSLGGGWYNDQNFSVLINSINARGFLSSRYDIFTDVWPPTHPEIPWYRTEGYPEDVVVNADGSLREGWLSYINGTTPFQGYFICSQTHPDYARQRISEDLQKDHYNCRFIDVELSAELMECYSSEHPTTRHQDALYRIEVLDVVKNEMDLVTGSEEAHDWAFPVVDYGEGTMTILPAENAGYDWSTPTNNPGDDYIQYNVNAAARIPLHSLVYHDVHIPTWYTGDGVSRVPDYWDEKDLLNILYASMPLFLPPDKNYWDTNREKFLTSYHLVSPVFKNAGFAKMINHEILSSDNLVQQTEFDNGWQVIANFSKSDYGFNDIVIPASGFYASDGDEKVYRIKHNGNLLAAAELTDRLFINPYEHSTKLNGVRTNGTTVLIKREDDIHLALIGDQESIEIHPDLLPWPLSSMEIHTQNADKPQLVSLAGGWIRMKKLEDERFYRLTGEFYPPGEGNDSTIQFGDEIILEVYPNPINLQATVYYRLAGDGEVRIRLIDLLGRQIETLVDKYQTAGSYETQFSVEKLSNGVYFLHLDSNHANVAKKVLVLK